MGAGQAKRPTGTRTPDEIVMTGPLSEPYGEFGALSTDGQLPYTNGQEYPVRVRPTEVNKPPKVHGAWFCLLAFLGCCFGFIMEVKENGWVLQPFVCPNVCNGWPCYEDGSPCEANLMYGPTIEVMDRMGAKNDDAIFKKGEWWRIASCNWLHAGMIHLAFNMMAVANMGVGLERMFGFWRIAVLYLLSGLFGTIVSVIFLPGVLSVGASASVFGLVGACWADVIVNYIARYTLRGSGIFGLLIATAVNMSVGLTPWVDNFMHVGGFTAGLVVGVALFSKAQMDQHGRKRRTWCQRELACLAGIALVVLIVGSISAAVSHDMQDYFRQCTFCEAINCVEISWFTTEPWWSCCVSRLSGTCTLKEEGFLVTASCNMSGVPAFSNFCSVTDSDCNLENTNKLCAKLCSACS